MDNFFNLLKESQQFSAEYDENLSNHLPMALWALKSIRASEEQLLKFYQKNSSHLNRQLPNDIIVDSTNWKLFLGNHIYNSAYRDYFLNEIKKGSILECLNTYLPILMRGVSGGAFHPLIRLAYAVEIDSEWEVSESLASWCMAYQELGNINEAQVTRTLSPMSVLHSLHDLNQKNNFKIVGDNVFLRLKNTAENKLIQQHVLYPNLSLEELQKIALQIYLSSRDNFTALHFVTSVHAFRIIAEHFKINLNETLPYLWQAICFGYVAIGSMNLDKDFKITNEELPSWEDIFEITRNHSNDHVIKLVYSAFEEFKSTNSNLYQLAAAQKVGLELIK